ncbi:MAG: c-type cytochrome [Flavobacterium sp.]|uniref:cbb3-type cytochrome c oxidase N-terminal domain-containing protein n=1 Tax=Flavobacterium sp. TaxID=239 RepID=UPI00121D87FA|nr:cbb3-type cytochrome c oxidase N-terminal domain-containing protein [Flavobacterium sp.]RZJ68684.1 MAG: c-type cytochrome [Flavobacterium sp.]
MKKFFPAWLRVSLIFIAIVGGIEYYVDSGELPAFVKFPMISLVLLVILVFLIAIEMTWAAVENVMYQLMSDEQKKSADIEQNTPFTQTAFYKNLMQKLMRTKPIESEGELLLNHDYDGIKELDNTLPPWWVYLFYATIFFGAVYLIRFEVIGADDQETELRKEMAQAKIDVEEWKKTAPDQMNEEKVTLLTSADDLAKGKVIFQTSCVACHRVDAGGQIGPNLTDEYWILGGGIKNVFHTITNGGRDGKGMIAWNSTLKPTEIQHVASYVLSLQGTKPVDPKAPDGELWIDKTVAPDSTKSAASKPIAALEKK